MNVKTAESFLPCYRKGKPMEKSVLKAVRIAEGDSLLRERLNAQIEFDESIADVIHSIQAPDDLRQKLEVLTAEAGEASQPLRSLIFHPAILSVLFGVLLMIGFLVWIELDRRESFPGKEALERIVSVAQEMSGVELEPTQALAGELGDTFYMRGFEGFTLAPNLSRIRAVGSRVFKQNGHSVAQLAIDPHSALLYVFRAADFGVKIEEKSQWKVFTKELWVIAVRENEGMCTAIAFRGNLEEMQLFLKTLQP